MGVWWAPEEVELLLAFIGIFALLLPSLAVFVPLWFPTGRPPSRRWLWAEKVAFAAVGLFLASVALGLLTGSFTDDIDSCASVDSCLEAGSLFLMLALTPVAIASLVVRWFRSQGVERQQLKVILSAFSVFGVGVLLEFGGLQDALVTSIFFSAGLLAIPIAVGVAVLRYRLYEIDRIISRTVAYALVVGLLGLVLFGLVAALGAAMGRDNQLVVAVSTLAVAALFNPVRRRTLAWVDRRFNRSRYDAEKVMSEFVGSLRGRVDPDGVVDGWVGVVSETMQPSSVGVWVR
jgi:hypothetical protein